MPSLAASPVLALPASALTAALLAVSLAAAFLVAVVARREHCAALAARGALLDAAAALHPGGRVVVGADGFPTLTLALPEGEAAVTLLPDTLVTRRLPQLWLVVTLRERKARRGFALGALARPTGAEFYALTPTLPDWVAPPDGAGPLLLRGANTDAAAAARLAAVLTTGLADPLLKEAAVTPRGVRLVRQVAQGERGAHLLLRQARFSVQSVPPALVAQALSEIRDLSRRLRDDTPARTAQAA